MADNRGRILEIVDSSGFLFQEKVAQEFRNSNIKPVLEEQHWVHPNEKFEGFADIVAISGNLRLVVECKRFKDAEWVFLAQDLPFPHQNNKFFEISKSSTPNNPFCLWKDFSTLQKINEANLCVIRRNGKDENLLESICTILVNSIEAIAHDEMHICEESQYRRIYVPVIVTTAKLYLCKYNLNTIDIKTGSFSSITESDPNLESIPFIRFRKSLGTRNSEQGMFTSLEQLSLADERSILIVQAESLADFLRSSLRLIGSPQD